MTASERDALVARVRGCVEMGYPPPPSLCLDICAEVERLTRERDAYAKAKAENDERFMLERDEARAEVERLREDAARLDYMDAQRNWTRWMGRDGVRGSFTVWPVFGNQSFRAAIDSAMTGGRDA